MSRWLVEILGESIDLNEIVRFFPHGEIYATREGEDVYLVGDGLEQLSEVREVRELASCAVNGFVAAIDLISSCFPQVSMGNTVRENDDGTRSIYARASGTIRFGVNAKLSNAAAEARDGVPTSTQAQSLLKKSIADKHLNAVISLWADPSRPWPKLYRILEEIERHLGQSVSQSRLCSSNKREQFCRSANSAEVAGLDSRHALGKFKPPKRSMSHDDAVKYVRQLLYAVLKDGH